MLISINESCKKKKKTKIAGVYLCGSGLRLGNNILNSKMNCNHKLQNLTDLLTLTDTTCVRLVEWMTNN